LEESDRRLLHGKDCSVILPGSIKVERVNLTIDRFMNGLHRLRLLHLSDLHISKFGFREKKLIHLVNRETPDVILVTGDLVENYKNDFTACIQTLKQLRSKYGIFAVFGNADHTFEPASLLHDFVASLEEIHVVLLNNRNEELKFNGTSFYLLGVDDPFFLFDNFATAIRGVPSDAPKVLLAHSPDILYPRADALVINLLERSCMKDRLKEWGWVDSTYFSPENGDVGFEKDGLHTVRVQSRQDGVFLDTILLNPYEEINAELRAGHFEHVNGLLASRKLTAEYPNLIVIPASDAKTENLYGKWKKEWDPTALFHFRLDDLPAQKKWNFQPLMDPKDFFEMTFHAKREIQYHVWIRMRAFNGSLMNDSVYLQFSDAVDENGRERYCINKSARGKDQIEGIDLILTGHTHGGQIRLPFYGPLATMTSIGKKYVSGLHRVGTTSLYVSRGVGTSVLPIRLFCPPEITVFQFHST
jgi:predicted MPP superfamily phosphohydrolase